MRLIFAGTPVFADRVLESLLQAGHEVVLVLTQPDKPQGRGLKLQASPVKQRALAHGLPVLQPVHLKDAAVQAQIAAVAADLMVVVAYGLLLPQAVLDLPAQGCLNVHASLLPRWRGAAPIHRAIEAGDTHTGVAIMHMAAGLDTGPVYRQLAIPLSGQETTASLHDTLAALGAQLLVEVLRDWPLPALAQAETGVTYAHKVSKADAWLDWTQPAEVLARKVRAFYPAPGAWTSCSERGSPLGLKIWRAEVLPGPASAQPGQVFACADGFAVACADANLWVQEAQLAGAKRMSAAALLAGHPSLLGQVLGVSALSEGP